MTKLCVLLARQHDVFNCNSCLSCPQIRQQLALQMQQAEGKQTEQAQANKATKRLDSRQLA